MVRVQWPKEGERFLAKCYGILLAAGESRRMAEVGPKMWLLLEGRPVLWWAWEHFQPLVDEGVIVAQPSDHKRIQEFLGDAPPKNSWQVVDGGTERHLSVERGISALQKSSRPPKENDVVLIHDAARFLLPIDVGLRVVDGLRHSSAVIPAIPVIDTIKQLDVVHQAVIATVPRRDLVQAQTPQGFEWATLLSSYRAWTGGAPTDDAEVVAAAGYQITWVSGDSNNRKLTTPEDFGWFKWYFQQKGRLS